MLWTGAKLPKSWRLHSASGDLVKYAPRETDLAYGEASMIPTLSEADVARVLKYEALIPAMEKALAAFSTGRVIQPVRNMLTIEEGQRFLGIMPAVTDEAMGAKLVSF